MFLVLLAAMTVFVSCEKDSSENEGDNTEQTGSDESEDPNDSNDQNGDQEESSNLPYAQYAVIYEMTDDSDIISIELLADGSYVVIEKEDTAITRSNGTCYFGFYEYLDDGSFNLNDFGIIKPVGEYNLDITRNGEVSIYNVHKIKGLANDKDIMLTNKITGWWELIYVEDYYEGVMNIYTTRKEMDEHGYIWYMFLSSTLNESNYYTMYTISRDHINNRFETNSDSYWYWSAPSNYEISFMVYFETGYVTDEILI